MLYNITSQDLEVRGLSDFLSHAENVIWNIINRPSWTDVIDILIVAILLYRFVAAIWRTRAIPVIRGTAMFVFFAYFSRLLGLTTLNWILDQVLGYGVIALLVLFQPEFRRTLEQLGRSRVFDRHRNSEEGNAVVVDELTTCLTDLAKRRVGALIVIEQHTGLQDVIETGTAVDAVVSAALLENIFEPNTPLHDGAVIIRGERVASAACLLTISETNTISSSLGTRHRAGLGISETTDALVLIVSEETGIISMARAGKLTRYLDEKSIRETLSEVYKTGDTGSWAALKKHAAKYFKKGDKSQ
ncbi:MAG: diadenylate cyclase CdaA [Clostridia bacterium]|nr:diadenylate cyclase CdaA [Clostridia bacterium]